MAACVVGRVLAVVHDLPVKQVNRAGTLRRNIRVVGDDHQGFALLRDEGQQQRHDFVGGGGVECAGGLVGEGDGRAGHLGTGDSHALGLAAGQLTDAPLKHRPQTQLGQKMRRGHARLLTRCPGEHGGKRHVFFGGEFGYEQPLLEDKPEAASP